MEHFSSLSAKEALHVAIFIEERNADVYGQFAELFTEFPDLESQEVAHVFADMAEEERHHGSQLQQRYFDRYGTEPCDVTDDDVREIIEMPRLHNDVFLIARGNLGLGRAKAMEVALLAERSARRFYARLAELTKDEDLRPLYRELAQFEDAHERLLEARIKHNRELPHGTAEA